MGTRAIYIFEDKAFQEVHVYKHYDNYPQGAVEFIEKAKAYAWELPRFEADEFGAAFVAANKNPKGGEVRLVHALLHDREEMLEANDWCDYYYVISFIPQEQALWVEIWESRFEYNGSVNEQSWVLIDELTHDHMKEKYGERAIAV
jgi:hypothetical protein